MQISLRLIEPGIVKPLIKKTCLTTEEALLNFNKKMPRMHELFLIRNETMRTLIKKRLLVFAVWVLFGSGIHSGFAQEKQFTWPEGIQFGLSLSFDDGRNSQVDVGTPLFDQYGVKATFVVVPSNAEKRLEKWKSAALKGHEIGNHSLYHPCSGNFAWSKKNALENYTLEKMRKELRDANRQLESMFGIKSTIFAYPCGSTFIGRGTHTKSYVPVVAELFVAGRGWLNESPNDPAFCDLAQLTGMEMDGKDFEQLLPLLESSKKAGSWLVLAGHDIGDSGNQTTRVAMLKKLIAYAQDPVNGVWIAPMGEIARYVKEHRGDLNALK